MRIPRGWLGLALVLAMWPGIAQPAPRLVLLVVIDQLSLDLFLQAKPHLGHLGLARLWDEGTRFLDATYSDASTFTGPGHACIVTGTYPHENGMVGNSYFDRATGKIAPILSDPETQLLDEGRAVEEGASPIHLDAEALGDRLRLTTGMKARVVAIALKDRAAVAMGGHLGQAYWFRATTGAMTTSSYYAGALPDWVREFDSRKLADDFLGRTWDRALPAKEYPPWDRPPYQANVLGLGASFPHTLGGSRARPSPDSYAALMITPFANELEVAFAKAAIDALQLGRNGVPDLLAVSFTSNDYIGHAFGPQSPEAMDAAVRVDQSVASLLKAAEAAAGKGNVLAVFTADHGAPPVPEFLAPYGFDSGRISASKLKERVSNALARLYGPADYVSAIEGRDIYIDGAAVAKHGGNSTIAAQTAASAARQTPGIFAAWTRDDLLNNRIPKTPSAHAAQLAMNRKRSGDVFVEPRPFHLLSEGIHTERHGTSHGTPYRYDASVPLAFWGQAVPSRTVLRPVDMADVATTLSHMLGVGEPASTEGTVIPEVFAR
jgi:hypothetical protein